MNPGSVAGESACSQASQVSRTASVASYSAGGNVGLEHWRQLLLAHLGNQPGTAASESGLNPPPHPTVTRHIIDAVAQLAKKAWSTLLNKCCVRATAAQRDSSYNSHRRRCAVHRAPCLL